MNKEKEILIRCSCNSPLFLSFWKDKEVARMWFMTENRHWLPFWLKLKYCSKVLFGGLDYWEDFTIDKEEMIRLANEVLEYEQKE